MRTLALLPDREGSMTFGDVARGARLDSPSIFYGPLEAQQPRLIEAPFSNLSALEFNYLMAFWRTATLEGALAFLINLPAAGADLTLCRATFEGDLQVSGVSAKGASCTARMFVIPVDPVHHTDAASQALVAQIAVEV